MAFGDPRIETYRNEAERLFGYAVELDEKSVMVRTHEAAMERIVKLVTEKVSTDFLTEHGAALVAAIDPEAIKAAVIESLSSSAIEALRQEWLRSLGAK